MALIKRMKEKRLDRTSVHEEAEASFIVFPDDNPKYLQINSYGSASREKKGKTSQSMQFGPEGIRQLKAILESL